LDSVQLTAIPKQVVQRPTSKLVSISMKDNMIGKINNDDLIKATQLRALYLDGNPISMIPEGAFKDLKKVEKLGLTRTNLYEIDFAVFAGMRANATVELDNGRQRKVGITKLDQFPAELSISMTKTLVQVIDPSLGHLFEQNPKVHFDMEDNYNVLCDGIDWLARYVICTKQVEVDRSVCADKDNTPLDYYLMKVSPADLCSESTTWHPRSTPKGAAQVAASILTVIVALVLGMSRAI